MAKYEAQSSRAATLADEEDLADLFRPARETKPRAVRPLPRSPDREAPQGARPGVPPAQDADEDEALFGTRRRVPVRKGVLPRSRVGRLLLACGLLAVLVALVASALAVRYFFEHDPRFRIDSASGIQILGNSQVTRSELLAVFGDDIGRNIFFVPLAARRAELEQLPWVDHATVMRLMPNQLRIAIAERIPVAFVREGNRIGLVDGSGVVLRMPPSVLATKHYSFPVVTGITPAGDAEMRADRMQIYSKFVADLDSTGSRVSSTLSEVDLSDPEDLRATLPGPNSSNLLVHFGDSDFANRYRTFASHLPTWQQQYPHLAAVDLRFDRQTVLEMAKNPEPLQATEETSPSHAAKTVQSAVHSSAMQHPASPHTAQHRPSPATMGRKAVHPVPPFHAPARGAGKSTRPKATRD